MNLKERLSEIINESTGIKATELSHKIATEIKEEDTEGATYTDFMNAFGAALEELVAEKQIIEIEYILPSMNYRIKSIYFPAGTEIRVKKQFMV